MTRCGIRIRVTEVTGNHGQVPTGLPPGPRARRPRRSVVDRICQPGDVAPQLGSVSPAGTSLWLPVTSVTRWHARTVGAHERQSVRTYSAAAQARHVIHTYRHARVPAGLTHSRNVATRPGRQPGQRPSALVAAGRGALGSPAGTWLSAHIRPTAGGQTMVISGTRLVLPRLVIAATHTVLVLGVEYVA